MLARFRNTLLVLMVFVCPVVAEAYTLVMVDGRRLEIPNNFTVGPSTLTYVAGTNIQVTIQLVTVDIPATERMNNEVAGSLKRRAESLPAVTGVSSGLQTIREARPTVTNRDLEPFRLARENSEIAYEKRRKELGLPSVEESRRALLDVGERAQQQLLSMRSEEQNSESYWRTRAAELRAELAATNARINFVQARLAELPLNYGFGGVVGFSRFRVMQPSQGALPFGVVDQMARGAVLNQPTFGHRQRYVAPNFSGGVRFGNTGVRGGVFINPRGGFGNRRFSHGFPYANPVAYPYDVYDNSLERSTLLTELDQLLANRAGLTARWQSLEEEARRSGAYPGWLR